MKPRNTDRHKRDDQGKIVRKVPDSRKGDRHVKRAHRGSHNQVGFPPDFIAIDGEGQDHDGRHIYTMLQCSDDTFESLIGQPDLGTMEILEWILALKRRNRRKIIVGFALNYDINMWLRGVPRYTLESLAERNVGYVTIQSFKLRYRVEWIPSKWFTLSYQRYDTMKREWVTSESVRIYDVFGFFQASFVSTLGIWGIGTPEQRARILAMKQKRGALEDESITDVANYCSEECELLVALMDKLAIALDTAGIRIKSWHGAGAIGAELLRMHDVKVHLEHDLPQEVTDAILSAMYGGRIQLVKVGVFENVWQHDVNSAYPSVHRTLPSWQNVKIHRVFVFVSNPWSVWHVKWNIAGDDSPVSERILTPFPFRESDGSIEFPLNGEGWYWYPEVEAAITVYGRKSIDVIEGYQFIPQNDVKPFAWIDEWYVKRNQFKRDGNPAQLPIKLGLNSLYGKMAQQSAREGLSAPYQSYIDAGYITSATRARLLLMAARSPESVIWFATDGIFSTKKLCDNDEGKPLGGWEVDTVDSVFVIQSGVYSFDEKQKTRGFNKDSLSFDGLRDTWRKHGIRWHYDDSLAKGKRRTFIGLKWAWTTGNMDMWCSWPEVDKSIRPNFKGVTVDECELLDLVDAEDYENACKHIPIKPNYQIVQMEHEPGVSLAYSPRHSPQPDAKREIRREELLDQDNYDTLD